ncbi:GPP34 family phosphoprotein [Actinoplanes sp. DH11]|uniref:GOLPH3/VPS74 family protein n=1 Tax=Actinoplanes sp. DH11 TaxID=2857011 RepID=UPI001E34F861|nr:GPP34 family phosphoprotein [Actinoplanes sp. DH11]
MPAVESRRPADNLWLAAHDNVRFTATVGARPLGIGLAAALIGELIHDGHVELQEGELLRRKGYSDDPALQPLLDTMQVEEERRVQAVPAPPWPRPYAALQSSDEHRHRRHGHDLGEWLSYLAYEGRAQASVLTRLARAGLTGTREHRRLLLGPRTVRPVPRNSTVAGTPASRLRVAAQRGLRLDWAQLMLAGLVLATGLHHQALDSLSHRQLSWLADELDRLDGMSRELLRAANAAIGEAAMR